MLNWLRRLVRESLAPDLTALEARLTTSQQAFADHAVTALSAAFTKEINASAALTMARMRAADDRLGESLKAITAGLAHLDAVFGDGLTALADRAVAEVRGAAEQVTAGPGTFWGARLGAWLSGPAGQAARYAVAKSANDPGMLDNDLKRREAVQWTRAWLREHQQPLPPDSVLGLLVEACVLERKASEEAP